MRESASTDLREPQGSNPLGPPGPELSGQRRSGRGGQRREGGLGTQHDALLEEADLRLEPDADAEF